MAIQDSLGENGNSVDLRAGDSLWFNELVEMEHVEVRPKQRRRKEKKEEGEFGQNVLNKSMDE